MLQANGELVAGKLFLGGFELRPIGEGARKSGRDVHAGQLAGGRRLVGQLQIQDAHSRIEIRADVLPENIRVLFQRVLRLNDPNALRSHLRLRAVNIQRRQGAQAQGLLVMLVALLGFIERLSLDLEIFPGENHVPIISHDLENDVVDFGGEIGARLLEVVLGDQNGRAIGKQSEVAQ